MYGASGIGEGEFLVAVLGLIRLCQGGSFRQEAVHG